MSRKDRKNAVRPEVLAANLRACRSARNLTQEQVAAATGVSVGTIKNCENGNNMPGLDVVFALARFYGVSIEKLLQRKRYVA